MSATLADPCSAVNAFSANGLAGATKRAPVSHFRRRRIHFSRVTAGESTGRCCTGAPRTNIHFKQYEESDVKRPEKLRLEPVTSIPVHDYRPALQNAVTWLGDRYLLAEPVTRRSEDRKPYFVETRRWHPATRH